MIRQVTLNKPLANMSYNECKAMGSSLELNDVELSELTEFLDPKYLNEISYTCSYYNIAPEKTREYWPKPENIKRYINRPLRNKINLKDEVVSYPTEIRRKSLYAHTDLDYNRLYQRAISNSAEHLDEKAPLRYTTDRSHLERKVVRTGLSAPPPPKLISRGPQSTSEQSKAPLQQRDGTSRANRAIHVVSGLKKGIQLPIPIANRTMANGDFGDDAAFFVETANNYVLGISDGAGGNRGYGFDPRTFARQLMRHCADYILAKNDRDKTEPAPSQTVFTALQMCQDRKIYGSGTICLCSFDKTSGNLHTINIGDSGFLIIRDNRVYRVGKRNYRDDGSNAPLQLDVYPWSFRNRAQFMVETNEIGNINDMKDCILMCPGDLLIMASDGVFDSIPQNVILQTITSNMHCNDKTYFQNGSLDVTKQRLIATADLLVGFASQNATNAPDDVIVVLAMFV